MSSAVRPDLRTTPSQRRRVRFSFRENADARNSRTSPSAQNGSDEVAFHCLGWICLFSRLVGDILQQNQLKSTPVLHHVQQGLFPCSSHAIVEKTQRCQHLCARLQGISDGFLAPYKVIKVTLDIDAEGWRPPDGFKDK